MAANMNPNVNKVKSLQILLLYIIWQNIIINSQQDQLCINLNCNNVPYKDCQNLSFVTHRDLSNGLNVFYWLRHVKHRRLSKSINGLETSGHRFILLLMSGIEQNPGPRHPKFPCGICKKACKLQSIACDECDQWLHKICIGMSTTEFSRLGNSSDTWKCPNCAAPNNSSIIYSTPQLDENNTNEQIINQSEHPSLIHSESDISFPSTSSITNETRSSVNTEQDSTFDILPETNGITISSPIKPK